MTYPELKKKIQAIIEPAVDVPDRWISRCEEGIRKAAGREGAHLFLGALTSCIIRTPGKLAQFFDDYSQHLVNYMRAEQREKKARPPPARGDYFTSLDPGTRKLLRDPELAKRTREAGEKYLEGVEWQAFRRRMGLEKGVKNHG